MKQALKKYIPKPFLRVLRNRLRKQHARALATFYQGDNVCVLQCCVSYNKYGGYCIPLSSLHRPAAQQILSGDVFEPDTIEFMRMNSAEGDIVHAGTYFGDFLPALSMSCRNDAKVWAFEPNPENFRCAQITTYINNLQNVKIWNAGLGGYKGTLPIMIYDKNGRSLGGVSQLFEENCDSKKSQFVEVEIVSLDDVLPSDRQISIVQLDVEGFEKHALAGAIETIKRCKPILILEHLPEEDCLNENILNLGYRITRRVHKNTVLAVSS